MQQNSVLSGILSLPIVGVSAYALSVAWCAGIGIGAGISGLVLGIGLLALGLVGIRKGS